MMIELKSLPVCFTLNDQAFDYGKSTLDIVLTSDSRKVIQVGGFILMDHKT